ncbi:glycosyltransferase family 2 protein [Pedobacter aquatilis]|uniref:glycosyltransferase family 2 protein n=1 Tax=Pedobacter aquatilis TaxID=351343 RepID=UPI00292FB334|nr:glycosyltransferase family 2 protein [Pedobacter aquatilis]
MLQNNPLVSVALCTYNGEKFIIEQLESIINQTYVNLEIIIIDDCSTDNTYELLINLIKGLPNIKLERNTQNIGFTKNFEKAIGYCQGDFIAISDQDDIWNLNKIDVLVSEIGENNLIFHDSLLIDENGESIKNLKVSDKTEIYQGKSNLYFLTSNCISGHACMFRRELLNFALPFDKRFFYDWWIAFVAASIGTIKYIPNALVSYRQHSNNITDILSKNKKSKNNQAGNNYFKYNIEWIEFASKFKYLKNAKEVKFIYKTLLDYSKGKRGINFIKFLSKYYTKLYPVKERSGLSKLNQIRKIYFSQPIVLEK